MNKEYKELNLNFYKEVLDNGLKVNVINKIGFKKKYVIIGTNYGSVDYNFESNGTIYNTKPGIAHFLEHKLFEMPDYSDAFVTLSKIGVSSNAYTSNNKTAYLFSTTDNIQEPLNVLLDFVYTPFFDSDSVEKEKGIISSEINMYLDYPDHQIEMEVIKNLYHNSTLASDIAGEVSDIEQINPEDLMVNYQNFYHPSNMSLVVVGDVSYDELLSDVKMFFKDKKFDNYNVKRLDNIENSQINKTESVIKGNVILEKFAIGFKLNVKKEDDIKRLISEMALEGLFYMLFSESSKVYQKLLDDKHIMNGASYRVDFGSNYRYGMFVSDSKNPNKSVKIIRDLLNKLNKDTLNIESFNRYKKYLMGRIYSATNSVEAIANNFLELDLLGIDYFKMLEAVNLLDIEDIYQIIKSIKKDEIVSAILLKK